MATITALLLLLRTETGTLAAETMGREVDGMETTTAGTIVGATTATETTITPSTSSLNHQSRTGFSISRERLSSFGPAISAST